jgi:hypothetical protein
MLGLYLTACLAKGSKRLAARIVFFFVVLHLSSGLALAQSSARTVQRPLDRLVDEADVIVHGRVLSARLEPHPQLHNLMTVFVTMSVQDTYKGKPANSLTFRQYVWNTAGSERASEYRKGQEMVLLLRPVSEYGLTSPAGLEQGRFQVLRQAKAKTIVVNGQGNFELFKHLEQHALSRGLQLSPHATGVIRKGQTGQISLDDLAEIIRTFARTR